MKRKIVVLAVAAAQLLVFGLLTLWSVRAWNESGWTGLAFNAAYPEEIGRIAESTPFDEGAQHISAVAPHSPASRAGIDEDEQVLGINEIELGDLDALAELNRAAKTGDRITYLLQSDQGNREIAVQLETPFRSPFIVVAMASSLVVGLIWLSISILVFWSRPHSRTANIFFLLASTGAAVYFVWALGELQWPNLRGIMPTMVTAVPWIFLGALTVLSIVLANLILHLALIFPKPRPVVGRWPTVFLWIHTAPFVLFATLAGMVASARLTRSIPGLVVFELVAAAVLMTLSIRLARAARKEGWKQALLARPLAVEGAVIVLVCHFGLAMRLLPDAAATIVGVGIGAGSALYLVGFLTVYSVLTCIALYRSYRESGVDIQRQVRWPLWGTLTALAVSVAITVFSIGFTLVSSRLGLSVYLFSVVVNSISKAAYLLIPLSFAFAILKYRLLDIDVIIRKTVIYSGVTSIVLALYLVLAGVSGVVLVRTARLEGETAAVFTTLVVVAAFVPIRNRVQAFVDRRFFRRERSLESTRESIAQMIFADTALEELLPAIADEVQKSLQCRNVALFVMAPDGHEFRIEASVGLADEKVAALRLSRSSDTIDSTARVVRQVGDNTLTQAKAEMAAVARRAGDPLGVVSVGSRLDGEPFDHDDEEFLGAVADQLSLAIGRSRQHRADAELLRAREIQQSLLPTEIPQIDGVEVSATWQPAREVSGDYYDVLRLDDDRLALCIGDVVGKGMPAALLMSSLQAALKAVVFQTGSPKEVCTQVRRVMLQSLAGGTFVTFFFCIVDRKVGHLSYCNAGHNPPIMRRSDGTLVRLDIGGPIFARIASDHPYHEATVSLGTGDTMVLYTDGVTEAADAAGDMFEDPRLEKIILDHGDAPALDLETSITQAVLTHTGGSLQDDLTLVVAKITGR